MFYTASVQVIRSTAPAQQQQQQQQLQHQQLQPGASRHTFVYTPSEDNSTQTSLHLILHYEIDGGCNLCNYICNQVFLAKTYLTPSIDYYFVLILFVVVVEDICTHIFCMIYKTK